MLLQTRSPDPSPQFWQCLHSKSTNKTLADSPVGQARGPGSYSPHGGTRSSHNSKLPRHSIGVRPSKRVLPLNANPKYGERVLTAGSAPEHERLEYQAEALEKLMHHNIIHAPITAPKRILEIGCGTGRTTVQLAERYPDAQVIGVDISPIPAVHRKPNNVEYIQGDFLELVKSDDKRLRAGTFDYVFSRLLVLGMTDWPGYIREVTNLLTAGGWLEVHEYYSPVFDANGQLISGDWPSLTALLELVERKGLDPVAGPRLVERMFASGLCEVEERVYRMPYIEDPNAPETWMIQKKMANDPTSLRPLWKRLGEGVYSDEELENFGNHYIEACANLNQGDHSRMYVVVGRKGGE